MLVQHSVVESRPARMNDFITDLDAALAESGELIILRRTVGTLNQTNIDCENLPANVRTPRLEELVEGITQDDLRVIISPTRIAETQWPGGGVDAPAPFNPDRSLPKKSDRIIRGGYVYRVEKVEAIKVNNVVVRIEMLTKGGAGGG